MMTAIEIENNYILQNKNKQTIGLDENDVRRMRVYQIPNGHVLCMDAEHARELIERYDASYESVKQDRENSILTLRRIDKKSERHFQFYSCLNHTDYWHCIDTPGLQLAVEFITPVS